MPRGPKKRATPRKVTFENDGRAPDTHKALAKANKKTKKPNTKRPTPKKKPTVVPEFSTESELSSDESLPETVLRTAKGEPSKIKSSLPLQSSRKLMGYPWKGNSCWYDGGLELWFRGWCQWSREDKNSLRAVLPLKSYICDLIRHFEARLRYMDSEEPSADKMLQIELERFRDVTRKHVLDKWKVNFEEGDTFGDSVGWQGVAVKASISSNAGYQELILNHRMVSTTRRLAWPFILPFLFSSPCSMSVPAGI